MAAARRSAAVVAVVLLHVGVLAAPRAHAPAVGEVGRDPVGVASVEVSPTGFRARPMDGPGGSVAAVGDRPDGARAEAARAAPDPDDDSASPRRDWLSLAAAVTGLALVLLGLASVWRTRRGGGRTTWGARRWWRTGAAATPSPEGPGPADVEDVAQPVEEASMAVEPLDAAPESVEGRLADEAMQHLRGLASAEAVTGDAVVLPDPAATLRAAGVPGQRVTLSLEVSNPHGSPAFLTPALTPLVASSGAVWVPDAQPATLLLEPRDAGVIRVTLRLPNHLPADVYRGALLVQGFRDRGLPVTIVVSPPPALRR